MKKFALYMVAVAAIMMAACKGGVPAADLKSEADTLSYTFGVAQGGGLKQYMSMRLGLDSTLIDEFLRGVAEGAKMGNDTVNKAYLAGVQLGQQIAEQWVEGLNYQITGNDSTDYVVLNNILAGFADGAKGKGEMTSEEAQGKFETMMQTVQDRIKAEKFGANKEAGEKFMSELAGKEGVQALENGVYYEVLTEGKGAVPADTSMVSIKYVGTLIDGTEFDRSRGEDPYRSRAGQFIPGFVNALTHMPAGSKWKVYIPQDQAYGSRETGQIKPFSALIFELELVAVD